MIGVFSVPYQSIDQIQKLLSDTVFSHTESSKKAAGRALGTIVEIITYYLIKAWGHQFGVAIERPLPEYANDDILHNVEFTYHRYKILGTMDIHPGNSISSTRIYNAANLPNRFQKSRTSRNLIKDGVIKNACTIAYSESSFCNAYISNDRRKMLLSELNNTPYAMFECKRVGVEEGMKKGPQTIEKAKQGAYVARTVSSLQRVRLQDGRIGGVIERNGRFETFDDYYDVIDHAIIEHDTTILKNFILTVGVVSNHGNWFTSDNQNKEMRVLAQSYDWLLFLTDEGLASFIKKIINGDRAFSVVRNAFESSYKEGKKANKFTKTNMDFDADKVLVKYFSKNRSEILSWFNVITPVGRSLEQLDNMLIELGRMEV